MNKKDKAKLAARKHYLNNKAEVNRRAREWAINNPDKTRASREKYRTENVEKERAHYREYNRKNRDKRREWYQNKYKTDPLFRVKRALRARMAALLRKDQRTGSAIRDLGCSVEQLKAHLQSRFVSGMSWDNYGRADGQWSVDHIMPLSSAGTPEEMYKLCHYTNLQPLWHKDNISKSNRLPNLAKYHI